MKGLFLHSVPLSLHGECSLGKAEFWDPLGYGFCHGCPDRVSCTSKKSSYGDLLVKAGDKWESLCCVNQGWVEQVRKMWLMCRSEESGDRARQVPKKAEIRSYGFRDESPWGVDQKPRESCWSQELKAGPLDMGGSLGNSLLLVPPVVWHVPGGLDIGLQEIISSRVKMGLGFLYTQ